MPDETRASREFELLESAWSLISNGLSGADAEAWESQYEAYLKTIGDEKIQPAPELPEGEYARVEIMGHDYETGWVTDGTRAGVPVMVIRDHDGQVIREVPGHALFTFVPLPTPLRRPEPQRALGVAVEGWNSAEDSSYDDDGESPAFDEAERRGEPF